MSKARVTMMFVLAVLFLVAGTPSAQAEQYDDCSIWAWITHNCAINPKGPCCQGKYRSGDQSGNAWHNNQDVCMSRLEQTHKVCLQDRDYTRQSCDASRRDAERFCGSLGNSTTLTLAAQPSTSAPSSATDQYDDCSLWAWITHNCAINPKGPCCQGHFRSAQQSENAWHNNQDVCMSRLEQTYKACLDDKAYTRRNCDSSRRDAERFCGSLEKTATLTLAAQPAKPSGTSATDQYDDCSLWAWITHNCAINPKGPCCSGSTIRASSQETSRSGKAWYNDEGACMDRLNATYAACRDDKAYSRQSCDQNKSKGTDFCKNIKRYSSR